jgi:sugar lactone lactonase YvrE
LSSPTGVSSDYSHLYIVDTGNNRVLQYSSTLITASIVYGQSGSFSGSAANNGGISASSLNSPSAVFSDSTNSGLYIVDKGNNRVLYYSNSATTASLVYGQNGNYSSNSANNGGISPDSLNAPSGVAVDRNKGVYIADTGNNRVLYYPSGSTTATRVFGQNGNYTTNAANNGGISASSLNAPQSVSVDYAGNIYIVDTGNNRVLLY